MIVGELWNDWFWMFIILCQCSLGSHSPWSGWIIEFNYYIIRMYNRSSGVGTYITIRQDDELHIEDEEGALLQ